MMRLHHFQTLSGHRAIWAPNHRLHPRHQKQPKGRYMTVYGGMYVVWTVNATTVRRHRVFSCTTLYVAPETTCPNVFCFLDVLRIIVSALGTKSDMCISDLCVPEEPHPAYTRVLPGEWTGTTLFRIIHPEPPAGRQWYQDTRVNPDKHFGQKTLLPK